MESSAIVMFQQTVLFDHNYIWIKPVCEFFKISVQNQQRKLKKDTILRNLWTKKSADLGKIDENGRILLSKKGFIRWIQIINLNTIDEPLRENFMLYQSLIFDYLYGDYNHEEQMKVDYQRLRKLRHLYAKIGREIQRVEVSVKNYLDIRYPQLSMNFDQKKQIT